MRKKIIVICSVLIILITGCSTTPQLELKDEIVNIINDTEIQNLMVAYYKNCVKAYDSRTDNNGMVLSNDDMKEQSNALNSYVESQLALAKSAQNKQEKELYANKGMKVHELLKIGYLISKLYLETEGTTKVDIKSGKTITEYNPDQSRIDEIKAEIGKIRTSHFK